MNGSLRNPQSERSALIGDPSRLFEQLDDALGVAPAPAGFSGLASSQIRDINDLRLLLKSYQVEMLFGVEWPSILQAYYHASRNEFRELLALDAALGGKISSKEFAEASVRVGQRQLNRLRPIRGHKWIQKYIKAIEDGQAKGWHTLVYGLALFIFSAPLRQGLLHYACKTNLRFIENASKPLNLSAAQADELLEEISETWPEAMNAIMKAQCLLPSPLK